MKCSNFVFVIVILAFVAPQSLMAGEQRFSFTADSTVLMDKETGLMWPLQDNGSDIGWPEAKEYCEKYSLGGYGDWRMPTQDELATLYQLEAAELSEYYIVREIKITACCLWAEDTKQAKVASFDFEYGNKDWGYPLSTVDARVLPVRSMNQQ